MAVRLWRAFPRRSLWPIPGGARLARMSRLPHLALLALLCIPLLGSRCDESEAVPLEELQRDAAPAFDYALYCDARGKFVGNRSGVLLVYRAEHLERVYAD